MSEKIPSEDYFQLHTKQRNRPPSPIPVPSLNRLIACYHNFLTQNYMLNTPGNACQTNNNDRTGAFTN